MLGFLLVFATGFAGGWYSFKAWGLGWGITCGIAVWLFCWIVLSLILRSKIMKRQLVIQEIMQGAQNKVNRQIEMFQRRPPSSMKAAQQIVEKIQLEAVQKSLVELDGFKSYYKWNMLLEKQINTMRVQLYYQLKDYKKVDEVLRNAMLVDPQTFAIKLVRMYRTEDKALDSVYKSKVRRFRGENRAFVACVYGWIKIKLNEEKKALDALLNARKLSDHPVLESNIEVLANNMVKHYSCSGFGEIWYALGLEEPKMKQPKRQGRMF